MLGTSQVVDGLRETGFDISHAYVAYLLRERVIAEPERGPGRAFLWCEADIERLRGVLFRRGRGPKSGRLDR